MDNDDIQQLKQYILNGDSFMDSGRFQDALQEYDKAIALKPEDRKLHYKKGICLVELGFGEGYLEEFERLNPDSTTLHSRKSSLLHVMSRDEESIQACDEAISRNPTNTDLLVSKAILLESMDNHEAALQVYDQALSLNPDNTTLHSRKSSLLHVMSRDEEAIQACDEAISRNPTNTDLLVNKAILLESMDNHEAALQVYDAAIDYKEQCVIPLAGSTDETLSESSKLSV